ncbi:MAG: hypothetical protein K6T26_08115 [Alicyclobacillus sp.]|nr:hypothetical protein [Alicyclobacillus sp.]
MTTSTGSTHDRPHQTRRAHQKALARARRRRQRRRRLRLRRLRLLRALLSLRFWLRAMSSLAALAALAFWAKFAYVYHIPAAWRQGPLQGIRAYVTVKPWWFGPPLFDLARYMPTTGAAGDPNVWLADRLGRYQDVLTHPVFVWVQRP